MTGRFPDCQESIVTSWSLLVNLDEHKKAHKKIKYEKQFHSTSQMKLSSRDIIFEKRPSEPSKSACPADVQFANMASRARCRRGHRAFRLQTVPRLVLTSWSWQFEKGARFKQQARPYPRPSYHELQMGFTPPRFRCSPMVAASAWSTCHFHGNDRSACSTVGDFPFSMLSLVAYRS